MWGHHEGPHIELVHTKFCRNSLGVRKSTSLDALYRELGRYPLKIIKKIATYQILLLCIVVLRPQYTSKVMSGRSVNLTTLVLGSLRPPKRLNGTSCTYLRQ